MLIIALDEGGKFEFKSEALEKVGVSFIGGALYSCSDKRGFEAELDRLQRLFNGVCSALGYRYPEDLHPLRDETGWITNREAMSAVKGKLADELPNFLNGTGNWESDPPRGQYSLYALAADKRGMEDMTGSGLSNLINDDIASNRYEHMAYRTVENLILYNPVVTDSEMKLELATRSLPLSEDESNAFRTLGYETSRSGNMYSVTNASGYRAAIASAIQNSDRTDINFEINVHSINYTPGASNRYHGFLYLADTLCSVYETAVKNCSGASGALQALYDRCKKLTPAGKPLLFSYSDIDRRYRRACRYVSQRDYFSAALEMKEAEIHRIPAADTYRRIWFDPLERQMEKNVSALELQLSLEKLDAYLHSPESNLLAAAYIHQILSRLAQRSVSEKKKIPNNLLFRLYRTEMTIQNHLGDHEAAQRSYECSLAMSQYVTVEESIELRSMYCVSLLDEQQFPEATGCAEEAVAYEEMLMEIKKELCPDNRTIFSHYGRTLSQLGQCYAFSGDFEKSQTAFEAALAAFGDDKINHSITLSYYLHMLIEKGDREKYGELAAEYFGEKDLLRQYAAIRTQSDKSVKYMLYVYVKALWAFYRDELKKNDLKNLTDKIVKRYSAEQDAHPWEMILKYCAFLTLYANGGKYSDRAGELMELSAQSVGNAGEGILSRILRENQTQFDHLCNGEEAFADSELSYMYR